MIKTQHNIIDEVFYSVITISNVSPPVEFDVPLNQSNTYSNYQANIRFDRYNNSLDY